QTGDGAEAALDQRDEEARVAVVLAGVRELVELHLRVGAHGQQPAVAGAELSQGIRPGDDGLALAEVAAALRRTRLAARVDDLDIARDAEETARGRGLRPDRAG